MMKNYEAICTYVFDSIEAIWQGADEEYKQELNFTNDLDGGMYLLLQEWYAYFPRRRKPEELSIAKFLEFNRSSLIFYELTENPERILKEWGMLSGGDPEDTATNAVYPVFKMLFYDF